MPKGHNSEQVEVKAVAEMPARLVYSLLKAAIAVAARANMPMAQIVELAQLAYFEETRRRHPSDLKKVAEVLGLSLRSIGSLNQRLRDAFFAAENHVQPARRITDLLIVGSKTVDELESAAPELSRAQIDRALDFLQEAGWLNTSGKRYSISPRLRSYVDAELSRRIDGLNNQMEVIGRSVWARFVEAGDAAIGRTWSFAARESELRQFIDKAVHTLRHGAIDLEESALRDGSYSTYGLTISFAELGANK